MQATQTPRAQAHATTGDAMMRWLLEIIELFLLDIVFGLWDWVTGRSRRNRTR